MNELSPAAMKLLLDYEVGGGEAYYKSKLSRPSWPGGDSGVTIGIGYDLGYTPKERFLGDWALLQDSTRERLAATIGLKGTRASSKVRNLSDISIPWSQAYAVFQKSTVPYWIEQTRKAFPGLDKLPKDAAGALVSLVFNRGTSMNGDTRREMREIRTAVSNRDIPAIAKSLRSMKRLWAGKGLNGLLARREAEAKLVEASK